MAATLVLVRHGEIVRPSDTSNFDPAPVSLRGQEQIRALAEAWPSVPPDVIYSSPLRRAVDGARVLGDAFGLPITVVECLREWAADTSGIPQPAYVELESRAWADLDFVPPSGESLRMAADRGRTCVEGIARSHDGDTVAIVGHGTLFALLISDLKGVRPSAAYKASIGFGHAAVLRADSRLRLVRDFAAYA